MWLFHLHLILRLTGVHHHSYTAVGFYIARVQKAALSFGIVVHARRVVKALSVRREYIVNA